ncbi:MAG TPA: DNA alkylation repair protein [Lachnospiraceae bacterium]|nr:DNA alkylation repair protein [Lachnospiraceae bacterium]
MSHDIRNELIQLAEPSYKAFSSKLIPGIDNMLGVRLPALRKIAKRIVKEDWRSYLEEVTTTNLSKTEPFLVGESFEEIMLEGMVIGYLREDIELILSYIKRFIPRIDNWSICDSFCSGLKIAKEQPEKIWDFIQPYIRSDKEYSIRFGVVMILIYYVDEKYIQKAFEIFDSIHHEGYYVRMAVAWAVSIFYVNYPTLTMVYLRNNKLDDFTYQKALQKIIESRAVSMESKRLIQGMKAMRHDSKGYDV